MALTLFGLPAPVIVVAGALIGALILFIVGIVSKKTGEKKETIDSEGLTAKLSKIFTKPVDSQGSKINDVVKMRGNSSTPRTIGLAVYGKENNINIVKEKDENQEYETKKSEGITYRIIEGKPSKLLGYKVKKLLVKLKVKSMETYDVPKNLIVPGDNYIWFKPQAHFVKFNGVKRHFDLEGLSRAWEASFSKTHENYLETMGDIPEQYSVLNNRISGQLKVENMKSQNFRKFEKLKKDVETLDAMDS